MTTNERPSHVIANPGDRRSLCGVKDPLPVTWAPFVAAHVRGHGMLVCAECAALLPTDGSAT